MLSFSRLHRDRLAASSLSLMLALSLLVTTGSSAFAHARYDRSDPPAGASIEGVPFTMTVWFTQELTSRSTIRVVDANGIQVDLGDGRVNMDDPDRKMMNVSLPELPIGVYTVETVAQSAEDGHDEAGTFTFGVGMAPPGAAQPAAAPATGGAPAAAPSSTEPPAAAPATTEEPAAAPAHSEDDANWWWWPLSY